MRLLKLALLLSVISAGSFAARGGGGGGGSRGGGGGGFRGGSAGGGFRGASVGGAFRGGGAGAFRGGFGGFRGGFGGGRFIGGRFYGGYGLGFGYYGYGWPYYGGYGYGYPYYDPYYSDPYAYGDPYGYSYGGSPYGGSPYGYNTAPAQPSQPVVVQQYTTPPAAQPATSYYQAPDFYLIAFSDHTIRAALSYRIQGDQIHWTTREHEEKDAPLSTVDRRFSEQINRDRRVDFRLP
jgi:hypothetical protein